MNRGPSNNRPGAEASGKKAPESQTKTRRHEGPKTYQVEDALWSIRSGTPVSLKKPAAAELQQNLRRGRIRERRRVLI